MSIFSGKKKLRKAYYYPQIEWVPRYPRLMELNVLYLKLLLDSVVLDTATS